MLLFRSTGILWTTLSGRCGGTFQDECTLIVSAIFTAREWWRFALSRLLKALICTSIGLRARGQSKESHIDGLGHYSAKHP